jgi:hypothetical protein
LECSRKEYSLSWLWNPLVISELGRWYRVQNIQLTDAVLNKMIMSTTYMVHVFQITSLETTHLCPTSLFRSPDWHITCIFLPCLCEKWGKLSSSPVELSLLILFGKYYKLQSHYSTFSCLLSLSPFAVGILLVNILSLSNI